MIYRHLKILKFKCICQCVFKEYIHIDDELKNTWTYERNDTEEKINTNETTNNNEQVENVNTSDSIYINLSLNKKDKTNN